MNLAREFRVGSLISPIPSAVKEAFLLTVMPALRQSALFNGSSKKAWHSRRVSSCLALTARQVGSSFPVLQLFRRHPLLHDLQLLPLPLNPLLKYGTIGSINTFTEQDDATADVFRMRVV